MFNASGDCIGGYALYIAPKLRAKGQAGANGIDVENAILVNCQVWAESGLSLRMQS
jgi:hypothetical protein